MSTRPQVFIAVSMIACPPSGVATLLVSATASPPLSLISRTVVGGVGARSVARDGPAEVVHDDARPTRREKERVLPSQAATCARDNRDPILEP